MSGISLLSYPVLSTYGVVSQTGMTTVNTTTVNNGYYGDAAGGYTGAFVATGSPSGQNTAGVAAANLELITLTNDLNAYTAGLTSIVTAGGTTVTITFLPNINYNSVSTIDFDTNAIINFDAQGDPNAKFYITAGTAITFSTITMNLLNGACAGNIFWLAGSAITFTTVPVIYGNMIAGTSITFTATPIIDGHIYAKGTPTGGAVSFTGTTLVDAILCPDIPPYVICYAEGTKILTETGYVNIENLKTGDKVVTNGIVPDDIASKSKNASPSENFRLKPVVWMSKFDTHTQSDISCPIRITANSLGENMPFEDLYVSPGHRIVMNGRSVMARDLVDGTTITQEYPHDTVTYYHLEMEAHYTVVSNGILAESYLNTNTRGLFKDSKKIAPRKHLSNWYANQTAF